VRGIDDQEAEIAETDGFCEQSVRSNHDIDVAAGNTRLDVLGVLGRGEAGQLRNAHRQTREPLGECPIMLA
jgi:hypothetical protein